MALTVLPIHLASRELYDCGWSTPTQSPKHSCWTLKEVGSPLGGDTAAGEAGGSGGEEGEGDLCDGSLSRREHSRSASDLVMRPHWAAESGRTLENLSCASWTGVQVEQKIWSSSQAWRGRG